MWACTVNVSTSKKEIIMVLQTFENVFNDPEKMVYYNKSPILLAVFTAMYEYKKAGHNFSDLPWFSLSKIKQKRLEKAT
jgi:hypothetical protein